MEKDRAYRSIQNNLKFRKMVFYILGAVEFFFAFQLIFKLLGANPENSFVAIIYTISGDFQAPVSGIFKIAVTRGIEIEPVLEPTTIIAMIVYAIIAYGVVWLFESYEIPKDRAMRRD